MHSFSEAERAAVYKAIMLRRDIRRQFESTLIPQDVLVRILSAAHQAGSVGFMQPWDFILIEDRALRQRVLDSFVGERDRCANLYEGPRRELFLSLKLEGILESALNLCITCDRARGGPHVLGRSTILETDLYSTCCAIQNLWLASRAEGIGVGWVSFQMAPNFNAPVGGKEYRSLTLSISIVGAIKKVRGSIRSSTRSRGDRYAVGTISALISSRKSKS
jgi:5,6-dimethylbenzimidazole synthase